jgi:hypothetical protein
MISNIKTEDSSEKRISLVYNSELSGYQALDFGKLNSIEDILFDFSGQGLNVHQDDLSAATDFVTAVPQRNSTISNFTPSGTNGTVLQANANRKQLFVQNMSTSHLHVKYGATADGNSFNFVLASSTNAGGGNGGTLSDLNYTGIVSVSGVNPNYISWERT